MLRRPVRQGLQRSCPVVAKMGSDPPRREPWSVRLNLTRSAPAWPGMKPDPPGLGPPSDRRSLARTRSASRHAGRRPCRLQPVAMTWSLVRMHVGSAQLRRHPRRSRWAWTRRAGRRSPAASQRTRTQSSAANPWTVESPERVRPTCSDPPGEAGSALVPAAAGPPLGWAQVGSHPDRIDWPATTSHLVPPPWIRAGAEPEWVARSGMSSGSAPVGKPRQPRGLARPETARQPRPDCRVVPAGWKAPPPRKRHCPADPAAGLR